MCKTCIQYSTGKNIELRFGSERLGPEFCYRADQAIRRCSLARVSGAAEKSIRLLLSQSWVVFQFDFFTMPQDVAIHPA